ncbi:sugar ABC transporter permease [Streptococcus pneumoniae]|nr:sugar ABC transporter permease [Streptococcus pneumoniae]
MTSMLYSTLFIPATAMTFPVYRLVNELGIYNTPVALILVYSCSGIAMSFFIIKNYFEIYYHQSFYSHLQVNTSLKL